MLTSKEKEQIIRSSGADVTKCMRCGKCSGTCPSYEEMEYHPHQFVYMVEKGEIDKLMNQNAKDFVKLNELTKEQEEVNAQLEYKMERWEYLTELNERIEEGKRK